MKCFSRAAFLFLLSISLIALAIIGGGKSRVALSASRSSDVNGASSLNGYALDDDPQKTVVAGFDFANLDRSVSACQDFNQFANGGWMARNPIPGAFSVWGRFTQLDEQNILVLNQILEDLLKKENLIGNEQKVEAEGIKPLEPELERINQVNDLLSLEDEIARFHAHRIPAIFGFGANQDVKDSSQIIAQLVQGGLGLPDRDYYTNDDAKSKATREEYVTHVNRTFLLMGDTPGRAASEANTVIEIETKLAQNSLTRVQRRNPEANYHPMIKTQLLEMTPDFDWGRYFRNIGLPEIGKVNVGQPSFFKAADKILTGTSIDDWKTYLRWHLVNASSNTLPSKFAQESFNFNGKYLQGTTEMLPRWRRCVASTDRALGEALGQLYVAKTFPPEARARARAMVANLIAALQEDLTTLSWMSDETRKRAISKLNAYIKKIGYPDKWRDYA